MGMTKEDMAEITEHTKSFRRLPFTPTDRWGYLFTYRCILFVMKIFRLPPTDPVHTLSQELAQMIVRIATHHKKALLLLSAGSWVQVYDELRFDSMMHDFSNISIGLVDERWVSHDDANSNQLQVRSSYMVQYMELHGASYIPIIQDMHMSSVKNIEVISSRYTSLIAEGCYLCMTMGIGGDGHTAGILPTSSEVLFENRFSAPTPVVYYEVQPSETTNQFRQRITVTPDFIRSADEVVIYGRGPEKEPILQRLLSGKEQIYSFPAQLLTEMGEKATLYTDLGIGNSLSSSHPEERRTS